MTFIFMNLYIWYTFLYGNAFEGASLYLFPFFNFIFVDMNFIYNYNIIYVCIISLFLFLLFNLINKIKNNVYINIVFYFLNFLNTLINTYINSKYSYYYFLFSYIFIYLLINNLIGLLPLSNTIFIHLNMTLMLSLMCWLSIIFIGIQNFGAHFGSLFFVKGIPLVLVPFLSFIEILSYFFRFISLALRLFANLVAGHILLETIYLFLFKMIFSKNTIIFFKVIYIILPFLCLLILILFEFIIVFLQSYVFVTLLLVYIKESINLH